MGKEDFKKLCDVCSLEQNGSGNCTRKGEGCEYALLLCYIRPDGKTNLEHFREEEKMKIEKTNLAEILHFMNTIIKYTDDSSYRCDILGAMLKTLNNMNECYIGE